MSKKAGAQADHVLRKYPELLNGFDLLDSGRDAGLRRMLRRHVGRARCPRAAERRSRPRCKRSRSWASGGGDDDPRETKRPRTEPLFTCPICRNVLETPVTVVCGHTFCRDCLRVLMDGKCFECGTEVGCFKSTNILVQDIVDKWRHVRQSDGAPFCRNQWASELHHKYYLRSRCNGLHANSWEYTDESRRTPPPPGQTEQNSFQENQSKPTWSSITASDLECILCSQCLLSPVTTTCGHTFCRECLARVLDHGLACPLCMAPLETTEQYRGETLVLTQALRLLASEEHRERVASTQQEIESLEKNSEIPIFICTNAFPKVACPLFVYEPRYRLLSRRCLQSSSKRFGMAAKSANGDKFALYGTLLEVRDCVNLQDGTSILTTIGLRRFKVLSTGEQDGYDTATVQYIRDSTVPDEKLARLIALHLTVHTKTVRWLETLKPKLLAEIERCIGCMPEIDQGWLDLPDGPAWTWWLIAILPLSIQLRVGFLASTSLEKRLLAIDKMLDHLKIRMKAVERNSLTCTNTEEPAETCIYAERSVDISYGSNET